MIFGLVEHIREIVVLDPRSVSFDENSITPTSADKVHKHPIESNVVHSEKENTTFELIEKVLDRLDILGELVEKQQLTITS